MDFALDDAQVAVRDLAAEILDDASGGDDGWLDTAAWRALADAGLLGIALSEDVGGGGLDLVALHLVLSEVGRTAAAVPVWPAVGLGALAVDRFAPEVLRDEILPGVCAGETLLTAALVDAEPADLHRPRATARRHGDGWVLSGRKTVVPIAPLADQVLVSATAEDGDPLVAVVAAGDGEVVPQEIISGVPHGVVTLADVHVPDGAVLGGADERTAVLPWLLLRARSGLASQQAGACAAAVRLAADYTSEREQFGRAIATFQAVSQRVADAHITAEGVRLTALEAAWRLAAGRPAEQTVAIAGWWAAEGSHRVLAAAHHVHGGTGVDLDYPLARYFQLTKQHEFALGDAEDHLWELGGLIADGD